MSDIITFADPGWDHRIMLLLLVPGAIFLGALVCLILSNTLRGRSRQSRLREWAGNLGIGGFTAAMVFGISTVLWASTDYNIRMDSIITAELERAGYSNIDLDLRDKSAEFIGSKDGDYFHGGLLENGDLRWQVVELVK